MGVGRRPSPLVAPCAAALLVLLARVAEAEHALVVVAPLPDTCPPVGFFGEEATRRGLRAPATLSLRAEKAEFVGEIRFPGGEEPRTREVRSATCLSVAETLLLIAEVHERPLAAPSSSARPLVVPPPTSPSPSASVAPPSPSAEPSVVAPSPPLALSVDVPPRATRAVLELPSFGAGVAGALDSAVGAGPAWGGRAFVRFTPRSNTTLGSGHGWASLAIGYARGNATVAALPITHERMVGRVDVVPYAAGFGASGRLGMATFGSLSRLVVRADAPNGVEDARAFVEAGLGPRVRLAPAGTPLSFELGLDLSFAITRRRFVVPERAEPVFRLPTLAFGAFFAVATR